MKFGIFENEKVYKDCIVGNNSNFRIVSMIPGDLLVAGCFVFLGGFVLLWKIV